ncbi:MAG TPA: CHAP domain-containing protein [Candidatus Saccharimonadales bacterium]|nr:CHAP domain-containing protein [Candidatus Saccharimonadales bacterium]
MVRLRFLIAALLIGTLMALGVFVGGGVMADQYDDQIRTLQQQNDTNQALSDSLAATASSYQAAINALAQRIDALQRSIVSTQGKIDSLQKQIHKAQAELDHQKKVLGDNIRTMYLEGDISTLEILASSKNISDFVNKQEYRNSVSDKITQTVNQINALKEKLNKEEKQQKSLLSQLQGQQNDLQSQENQKAHLLNLTETQKAAYDRRISSNNAEIISLRQQQAAAIAALTGSNGNSPVGSSIVYHNLSGPQNCGGGYGYCYASLDQWVPDNWGLHYARECVHYVANALVNRGYSIPYNLFAGRGNAYQWAGVVTASGTAYVDHHPSVNAVVYFPIGTLGHVGIIDWINPDGSLHVSQMNWYPGEYNTMDVTVTSNLEFLHFHK